MNRSRAISIAGALSLALTLGVAPALADTEPAPDVSPVPEAVDAVDGDVEAATEMGTRAVWEFESYCVGTDEYLTPVEGSQGWNYSYEFYRFGWEFEQSLEDFPLGRYVNTARAYTNLWDDNYFFIRATVGDDPLYQLAYYDLTGYRSFCGYPTVRLEGADRYAVSYRVSDQLFHLQDTVYVANGLAYADALAAAPVAGVPHSSFQGPNVGMGLAGPILLTQKDVLTEDFLYSLSILTPKRVVLLGGTGSISLNVENRLRSYGYNVERWAGADRYEVALNISRENFDQADTVIIANGLAPADALAASAFAAQAGSPILLTRASMLSADVISEIIRLNAQNVILMGGTGSISADLESQLRGSGWYVTRIGGASRYDVAAEVALQDFERAHEAVYVANGLAYADALSAAPAAGLDRQPILLVQRDSIPASTRAVLELLSPNQIVVLGGPGSVSAAVMNQLEGYTSP